MDIEAAFKRERLARKKAEQVLEEKSRELYLANNDLKENIESLKSTLLKNDILNGVNNYGVNKESLKDFLPKLVRDMLKLVEMPFGIFDHYSFHKGINHYRSDVLVNNELPSTQGFPETIQERVVDEVMDTVSKMVFDNKKFMIMDNLEQKVDEKAKAMVAMFNVNLIIGLPIISLERVSGVIYLFSDKLDGNKKDIIVLYQDALKQLGYLIEHRYQEEILEQNFKELKQSSEALKSAQDQLLQSEKMASIGQLSAGIAHEINNPMGFIKSNMSSLTEYIGDFKEYISIAEQIRTSTEDAPFEIKSKIDKLSEVAESIDLNYLLEDSSNLLDESTVGITRVVDIISGLKRFSRQSDNTKEACNIQEIVEEALKLAHNELKYNIEVSTDFNATKNIEANNGELIQVFLNMLINAAQAVSENGLIKASIHEKNNGVEVSIKDNGEGIDKDTLDKIFNPFFTTKDVGIGTGLGLSISYGIIQDHQGTINVDSTVGEGTNFIIWLPFNNDKQD